MPQTPADRTHHGSSDVSAIALTKWHWAWPDLNNIQGARMPTIVKILLACLICLGVAAGVIWLVQTLFA
jgi:hypothetical protein